MRLDALGFSVPDTDMPRLFEPVSYTHLGGCGPAQEGIRTHGRRRARYPGQGGQPPADEGNRRLGGRL